MSDDGQKTIRLGEDELEQTLPMGGIPRQLGPFDLVRELGRGGMGIVFEAIQQPLGRRVALKILPADERAAEQFARFRQEAASIARLTHENVVAVYTWGEEPGWTYFAMELVSGEDLETLLNRGPLLLEQVLDIALQITRALGAAHSAGILHRDIKPGNILVEPSGRVRVADFGLARGTRDDEHERQLIGTPEYMSPEQASGTALGPATDIYALGVLLYRILGGQPPFASVDPLEVLAMHQLEVPLDLRQLAPLVPFELGGIVMRCLAKRPAQRFGSAAALEDALEVFRLQYNELRHFLNRDGHDTEALVIETLGAGADQTSRYTDGLRYVEATVLVADLENFLRLAVALRPEYVTRLLETFYKRVRQTIEGRRGTVVELFGDTILATFGDPIPIEGHAELALSVALELQQILDDLSRDLRPPVSVRIGLETGLLLAGYIDDGRGRSYHAYGDSVAIAHALERRASRSEILVGEALWQATQDRFGYKEIGELPIRLRGQVQLLMARRLSRLEAPGEA